MIGRMITMKNGEIDSEKEIGNGKTHQNIALLGCLGSCYGNLIILLVK